MSKNIVNNKTIGLTLSILIIVVGTFASISLCYILSKSTVDSIRYSGGLLQIVGFGIVSYGLFDIYQNYSRNPFTIKKLWLQIKRKFGYKPPPVYLKAESSVSVVDSVNIEVVPKLNTIEDKVNYLEKEIMRK